MDIGYDTFPVEKIQHLWEMLGFVTVDLNWMLYSKLLNRLYVMRTLETSSLFKKLLNFYNDLESEQFLGIVDSPASNESGLLALDKLMAISKTANLAYNADCLGNTIYVAYILLREYQLLDSWGDNSLKSQSEHSNGNSFTWGKSFMRWSFSCCRLIIKSWHLGWLFNCRKVGIICTFEAFLFL